MPAQSCMSVDKDMPAGRHNPGWGRLSCNRLRPLRRMRAMRGKLPDEGDERLRNGSRAAHPPLSCLLVAGDGDRNRHNADCKQTDYIVPDIHNSASFQEDGTHGMGEISQRIGVGNHPGPFRH